MPVQESTLPALVRHEQSPHLHILVCEVCGTKADFHPEDSEEFAQARRVLERHRCKGQ
jgi:Fe2+ or Zn2+ uptake regulation protein